MTITVSNRELGTLHVHTVIYSPIEDMTTVGFHSEAGELIAYLHYDGRLHIQDPEYPRLRFRNEAFRPLIEEALRKWEAESPA